MATHRAIPGANLPETGTTGRKGRSGSEAGLGDTMTQGAGTTTGALPGESGLGAGVGTSGSMHEGFGTTSGSGYGESGGTSQGARTYPRAVGVMDQVKQTASTRVNEQKARAAEGLGSMANAIRQASEHMRAENQTLAAYADRAVDQIQQFADRMRDKDPAEMVRDVERFARRNPAAFVGGAFLLGLGVARFLKSSSAYELDGRDSHRDSGFDTGPVATTPLPGQTGFTGTGAQQPWGAEPTRTPGSSLTIDPAPGITS